MTSEPAGAPVVAAAASTVTTAGWTGGGGNTVTIDHKGRTGVLVSLGTAVLAGGGVAWMNWLLNLGQQL